MAILYYYESRGYNNNCASKEYHFDIYLGRIPSDYAIDDRTDKQYSYQREVDWINNFKREDLDKEALKIFISPHFI